jgi:glycerol-3-phosphate dehydrogenase subunit C
MSMYDVHDAKYWDDADLEQEMRRVYDVCHLCRMCFSYCPSFPALFDAIDEHEKAGRGETDALTREEMDKVVDLCWQCKLCYVKCPYTPPHKFMVDFPRLMLRNKAVRARRDGVTLQDKVLGDPDGAARRSTGMFAGLVNWANKQKPIRVVLEKTIGIHRDRVLPLFASETFETWFAKRSRTRTVANPKRKVVIFETCSVNYNYPSVGRAAVQVLEHNNIEVLRPPQVCCGMPAMDGGDVDRAIELAKKNVANLLPLVKEGMPILVCSPTCGYVLKQDWPDLLNTDDARLVAANTFDIGEYLAKLKKEGELDTNFTEKQGKLAYHIPCHLRAQNIGQPFTPLMKDIPDTSVEPIEQCSAFDGTWGMKKEYYQMSRQCAGKLCNQMAESNADRFVSDCMMAGLNVVEELGKAPVHPVEVLRDGYGLKDE